MSSSGSHEEAAAALDALAWLDDDEALVLAQMFGGGGGVAGERGAACALDSPASPEGSEGGSSGRGSACTVPPAGVVCSGLGTGARMAPATKLPARLDGLRWLDPECSRGCDLCIAAPPASSEGSYQLVGDLGKKNGEKKLRRLLTKTPEWNSADERVRMAADCDARGSAYTPLALVMRGRENCSALRKGHLLHLARVWGYASHLWRKRNDPTVTHCGGMQARVAAAAAALRRDSGSERDNSPATTNTMLPLDMAAFAPPALPSAELLAAMAAPSSPRKFGAPLFDPFNDFGMQIVATNRMQHVGAVSARIRTVLAPLAAESARLFAGHAAGAAAAACTPSERRFLTDKVLSEMLMGIESTRSLASSLNTMRRGAVVASARATASTPPGSVPGPAWRALLGTQLPCEATVALLSTRFGAAAAFSRARAAKPEQLNAAEAAWLDELYRGQMAGLELMTQVAILQHEIKLAPMDEFMDCVGAVLEMLRGYASDCALNFSSRATWVQRLMPPPASVEPLCDDVEAPSTPLYRFMGRQEDDIMPVKLAVDPPPGTGAGCEDILAERDAALLL